MLNTHAVTIIRWKFSHISPKAVAQTAQFLVQWNFNTMSPHVTIDQS